MTPEFRVWHPDTQEFEYLKLQSYNYGSFTGLIDNFGDDQAIWEPYTGLKDVNGNQIFEGDIVKTDQHGYNQSDSYVVKEFIKNVCVFRSAQVTDGSTMFEEATNGHDLTVIGNVHENPELLEALNESK